MPSLNFTLFIDKVIDGTKPHTIRALRQRPFAVDDDLSFFTAMRTSSCRRLRPNTLCTAAVPILILPKMDEVRLGKGSRFYSEGCLHGRAIEDLARRDGFDSTEAFFRFFSNTLYIFSGQLIEWRP